jgi:hypothetical protein
VGTGLGGITVGDILAAAASTTGAGINTSTAQGSGVKVTCHDSQSAWAVEAPLTGSTLATPKMWCVDSTGTAKQETTLIAAVVGNVGFNCP